MAHPPSAWWLLHSLVVALPLCCPFQCWSSGLLAFPCPIFRWLLSLIPSPGCPGIWMSQPDQDSEVVELSLQLSGLSITVRGSPSRAADFVRGLSDPAPTPTGNHGYPQPLLGTPASSVASWVSSSVETRCSIASEFPTCPAHWIGLASSRLSGSRIGGADRARRAWLAGCWARAVIDSRVGSPNRSAAIELPNRLWCVLSCQGLSCPRVFTTSRQFFAAVGQVEGSTTVCHAFPSETESRIYFKAAGFEYPSSQN